MADRASIAASFMQHNRTGKYTDLRLVAKDGTSFDVHKLVCPQLPVLETQAAGGMKVIEFDDTALSVKLMVQWTYGIDDTNLLTKEKSIDEATTMDLDHICDHMFLFSELSTIAQKVRAHASQTRSLGAKPTVPTRRNEPLRISAALPKNDPPPGPYCHCLSAESDKTLLPCASCG
jgi:hypothetical protein